jgi:hypothetical protein
MTALFTDYAFERIRGLTRGPNEAEDPAVLLGALDAATSTSDVLAALPGTIRLAGGDRGDLLVVKHGNMRAAITTDPGLPGQLVVANVYRADEEEKQADVLRAILERGENVAVAS